MLDYFGMKEDGDKIRNAVKRVLEKRKVTPDLGGNLKTNEVVDEIIKELRD